MAGGGVGGSLAVEPRQLVRQKLRDGRLPRHACSATILPPGAGRRCDSCDGVMALGRRGILATFADGTVLRLHPTCFIVWDTDRQRIAAS